ncbi:MAG TPA: DUF1648 domain-containing protein [Verrucomicrobiae bacterium]|nr:DUF1648 domain-containing protein [Verrucomicrobiae bacterium]
MPLEELEIHLREEIEQQMQSGLDEAEAFNSAVQKIGHAYNLQMEFKKINRVATQSVRNPAIVFAFLLIGYVIFISCTVPLLPPRVASHFDINGQPNGWMSRSSAAIFQGVIGLVLSLIIVAGFYAARFASEQKINMPRRDFWFAPERRGETCAYLLRQGLWLASMEIGLQCVVWYQLVESNDMKIPHLSSFGFLAALGVFGIAMITWIFKLFRHFAKAA